MTEFAALFGFLGGVIACHQLATLRRHRVIRTLHGQLAELRERLQALEARQN